MNDTRNQEGDSDQSEEDDGQDMSWLPIGVLCPAVASARVLLAAVLVAGLPFDASLTVSEAIDVLSDTWPLLAPLDYPDVGVDAVPGLTAAVTALTAAVQQAPTGAEAMRAGLAGRLLRDLLEQIATGTDLTSPRMVVPRGP